MSLVELLWCVLSLAEGAHAAAVPLGPGRAGNGEL
jgi:hypothetical protein